MKYLTVKDLPESDRPYEKCEKYGPSVLSDSELLAIIIKAGYKDLRVTELASKILNLKGNRFGINILNHLTVEELKKIKGIGKVKAIQLLATAEISKRMAEDVRREGISFANADQVAGFYMERMRHLEREQTRILYLDSRLKLISDIVLFEGAVGKSMMEPREILREGLRLDAVHFIMLHNHPSGDPVPSEQDKNVTKFVKTAADYVGIRLRDHIIIGDNRYISFKADGLL